MSPEYSSPETVAEALSLLDDYRGEARVIAGGTDLLVQMKKKRAAPERLVDIGRISSLDYIREDGEGLHLGPLVTHAQVARADSIGRSYTALQEASSRVAAWQVQNLGTIGGNICNGSPSAETAPPLMVFGGKARISGRRGEREVGLEEFFRGPGETILEPDELLTEIRIPPPGPDTGSAYIKLSPRRAMDVAVVGAAAFVRTSGDGQTCMECRLALGAVAPTPVRARDAEAAMIDSGFSYDVLERAGQLAVGQACPIDDMRGTADYRCKMVAVTVSRALELAWQRARKGSA